MKQTLMLAGGLLLITLSSCTKSDVLPLTSKTISNITIPDQIPRPIPQGTMTVTWDKPEGQYPNTKHIHYNMYLLTPYEVHDGVKHTTFLVEPSEANVGDTVSESSYGNGYRIAYVNQLDTMYNWRKTTGRTTKILLVNKANGLQNFQLNSDRAMKDKNNNLSSSRSSLVLSELSSVTISKSGTADGADRTNGVRMKWKSTTTNMIKYVGAEKYRYPVAGTKFYDIDGNTEYIQYDVYNDMRKDNIITVSVNGGKPEKTTLPHNPPGLILEGEDD